MESNGSESASKFPPPKSFSFNRQDSHRHWIGDYGLNNNDRRFAFSRNSSFRYSDPQSPISIQRSNSLRPNLLRSDSSISIDDLSKGYEKPSLESVSDGGDERFWIWSLVMFVIRGVRSGNRSMKRLALMISLNAAYSTIELMMGLFTGRVGLVSDAFHLTFGCGLLTFSLFAMAASRKKPDGVYTYGYKRLEVLAAFTNAIRSGGLILASWFLSLGVENAEALCLGLVSVAVLMVIRPLFQATGSILLQMAPPSIPHSALSKCYRQITALEDVSEVSQARFWEVVPGHAVGSVSIQVKKGVDDHPIMQYVHGLYHDLGIQELSIQTDHL